MLASIALRRGVFACAVVSISVALLAGASASVGDLSSRQQSLQRGISADNGQIQLYQGRLQDLRTRLSGLESSLAIQRALLLTFRGDLQAARTRLSELRAQLVQGRRALAAQLVAQYESPSPDLIHVVIESHGFADLLERVTQMRTLAHHNAGVVKAVMSAKAQVAAQTARLTAAEARQRQVTSAVLVERDQIAAIRYTVQSQQAAVAGDRAHKQAELQKVQHQLSVLQARAAAAQSASFASSSGGAGFGGGDDGFFPAPGTNYSFGQEPEIAARLDRLGKALGLHLIGLSGYRSPQHSVEVGGFADDPHTRGEASDTPGVEGIPEQTLLQFGLTRPFPGPAEADHIQLA